MKTKEAKEILQTAINNLDEKRDANAIAHIKHVMDRLESEEVNGWSNYATWRVHLEMLDGYADVIREDGETFKTVADLADRLESYVDDMLDIIEQNNDNTPIEGFNPLRSYADCFVNDVNWREIAETMISDNHEFLAHGDLVCETYRDKVLPNEEGRCSLCDATLIEAK